MSGFPLSELRHRVELARASHHGMAVITAQELEALVTVVELSLPLAYSSGGLCVKPNCKRCDLSRALARFEASS